MPPFTELDRLVFTPRPSHVLPLPELAAVKKLF
jgi:hypothetical protein